MTADFLQRVGKEAKITLSAAREALIAISERVNRKAQILNLLWQASIINGQVDTAHQDLGEWLSQHLARSNGPEDLPASVAGADAQMVLLQAVAKIRVLKQEVIQIDTRVRELEIETLREDLVKVQYDLSSRSASIRRIILASDAAASGASITHLNLPATIRVAAVFRGPIFLSSLGQAELRAGDLVVLVGPRDDLANVLPLFQSKERPLA